MNGKALDEKLLNKNWAHGWVHWGLFHSIFFTAAMVSGVENWTRDVAQTEKLSDINVRYSAKQYFSAIGKPVDYKVFQLPKTLLIQVFFFIVQARYWLYNKNKHLDK